MQFKWGIKQFISDVMQMLGFLSEGLCGLTNFSNKPCVGFMFQLQRLVSKKNNNKNKYRRMKSLTCSHLHRMLQIILLKSCSHACVFLYPTHTHTLLKGCIKRLALHLTSTLQPQYGLVIKTVIHRHLVFDNL